MSNPLTFIIPGLLIVLITLCIAGLAGAPPAPKPDKDEPTDIDLLRRELRETKRRAAIEKGGAR
jgi:hypothetical protein